jgi:hypothetical protein
MTSDELKDWVATLRTAVAQLTNQDFGYPLDTNEVLPAVASQSGVPTDLEPLYAVSDGVSLPDVYVGYFIDTASRVAAAAARGDPTRVEGGKPMNVHVFGRDGGGGRFALCTDDGSVQYLPASGAVREGVFQERSAAVPRRLADTLIEFLWMLVGDVEAFVHDRKDHKYLAG